MKCLPGSWKEIMFGNISRCMIFSDQLLMTLSGCVDRWDIFTALGSLNHCCRPEFWMHSNLGLFSNRRKQINIPKFLSSLPCLPWPCHLPVPLRLFFHWPHHLTCQPCVYSVLCTATTQDFLDSVQTKDQTLVFLPAVISSLPESFQSKVICGWEWTIVVHPEKSWICVINNSCLEHCISVACFILL